MLAEGHTMTKTKIVLSDLHLGAGLFAQGNALEDFSSDEILAAFLDGLATESSTEGGPVELILAGDTFEFLQVPDLAPGEPFLPTVHYPADSYRSATEESSRRKMAVIVAGHPRFFEALRMFARPEPPRRMVTVLKGNHDINLHWRAVQDTIRAAVGALGDREDCLSFVERRVAREGIYVEHGNQYAGGLGRFPDFEEPHDPDSPDELYQPIGSRCVYELLNDIEWQHYWVDGVKPFTALVWYTLVFDFPLAIRMLKTLLGAAPHLAASASPEGEGALIVEAQRSLLQELDDAKHLRLVQRDAALREGFCRRVAAALGPLGVEGPEAEPEVELEAAGAWRQILLARGMAEEQAQRGALTEVARLKHTQEQAQVVVFGHSHEPCCVPLGDGAVYLNTGTWTWRRDFGGESYSTWRRLFRRPEQFTNHRALTYVRINYDEQGVPQGQLRELHVEEPPAQGPWMRLHGWLRGRR